MNELTKFEHVTDEHLETIAGGVAPALLLALFMAGYTIGKDLARR